MYTKEAADAICGRLAEGESLRAICKDTSMPSRAEVFRWLADDANAAFRDQYARAREYGLDMLADEILEIADNTESGVKTTIKTTGVETTEGDMTEHRRLKIEARKWTLSKLAPKKYGDKLQAEIEHSTGKRFEVTFVSASAPGKA